MCNMLNLYANGDVKPVHRIGATPGLSYGDYLEQLSVLLFLKLAHEQTQPPWNQESPVPEG